MKLGQEIATPSNHIVTATQRVTVLPILGRRGVMIAMYLNKHIEKGIRWRSIACLGPQRNNLSAHKREATMKKPHSWTGSAYCWFLIKSQRKPNVSYCEEFKVKLTCLSIWPWGRKLTHIWTDSLWTGIFCNKFPRRASCISAYIRSWTWRLMLTPLCQPHSDLLQKNGA